MIQTDKENDEENEDESETSDDALSVGTRGVAEHGLRTHLLSTPTPLIGIQE